MSTITTTDAGTRIGCDECTEQFSNTQSLYNHTEQTGHTTYAEVFSRTTVHRVSEGDGQVSYFGTVDGVS